jgi:ABC-type Fe3+-hydroxamate transport system substrate-binding protein
MAVTRRDASGADVALAARPERIVSLVPSITETLFALGLDDRIAGITLFCVEPRARVGAKPKVGREKDPDVERILALAPDLVVANIEENRRDVVERLRAAGIPVWVTFPRTLREGIRMIRELGDVTGAAGEADRLATALEARYAATVAASAARPPVPVFCPIWRGPYMTINRDTYVHDVLATCGARNVFADHPDRYPTVTLDDVRVAAPEVILLPDEPYHFRPPHLADFAAFADIPAVAHGRCRFVDGKLLSWYGPRIGEALDRLPALLAR